MKIVIDVDKLLEEGRITTEEYERLNALAVQETGSLAFNILIGFGVIATAGGALALLPSGPTAILLFRRRHLIRCVVKAFVLRTIIRDPQSVRLLVVC